MHWCDDRGIVNVFLWVFCFYYREFLILHLPSRICSHLSSNRHFMYMPSFEVIVIAIIIPMFAVMCQTWPLIVNSVTASSFSSSSSCAFVVAFVTNVAGWWHVMALMMMVVLCILSLVFGTIVTNGISSEANSSALKQSREWRWWGHTHRTVMWTLKQMSEHLNKRETVVIALNCLCWLLCCFVNFLVAWILKISSELVNEFGDRSLNLMFWSREWC